MGIYESLVRPLLFSFDPERIHEASKSFMKTRFAASLLAGSYRDPCLELDVAGLHFMNPLGIAPGFDKNCEVLGTTTRLGFGYVIPGSILLSSRQGNPYPRIVRHPEADSLANSLGLPSKGLAYALEGLKKVRRGAAAKIIPNITGFNLDEYLRCFEAVQPYADAVEVNLECPNIRHEPAARWPELDLFLSLMEKLREIKKKPLFLKLSAYQTQAEREDRLRVAQACAEDPVVDGITVGGGLRIPEQKMGTRTGNLTGKAIFGRTLSMVSDVYAVTDGRIPIKAAGGVFTGYDAFLIIATGASLVEMLTSLVYRGPGVARAICEELSSTVKLMGHSNVTEIRGMLARKYQADVVTRPLRP